MRNNQKVLYSSSATNLTSDRMEQLKNITCYRCLRRFNQQNRKTIQHSCYKEVTCELCWRAQFRDKVGCLFKCRKPNKERKDEARVCARPYRLLDIMPLDSEVHCVLHPKETVLHYDHSSQEFKCLQCERLERQTDRSNVVESDRCIIKKSLHVLNELLLKRIADL